MKELYTKELNITSSNEMISLGEKIGQMAFSGMIITLNGDLGAGKTTLTKGIAKALGITKIVNSPTFTIMKIYDGKYRLYHMDVYRINSSSDDFELEEYLYLDGVCVIEWAERIKDLLPDNILKIDILNTSETERHVIISASDIEYKNIILKL